MDCPKCQAAVAPGGRFCASCGFALTAETPTVLGSDVTRLSDRAASSVRTSPSALATSSGGGRFSSGHLLGDRYRIVRRLGRGGMGEVYLADDLKLAQPVALKFLPQVFEADPSRLAQLQNEVRLARQVSHPNVCRVYDLADAEGVHFLTMEYVDGEDLASLQRRIGRLPEDRATGVARQIAGGVAAAHARGVLHRDLKPANVMMDADGHVRLTDFGLAVAGAGPSDTTAGTPAYMAPEQLAGEPATERSDIFAFGLVLYELFTGRRAFSARTVDELREQHRSRAFASPAEIVNGLHPAIDGIILRCLDPDPTVRPASALAVSAALPGGDPLAAALAAGETPSPELVAASGGDAATLSPIQGALLMLATLVCLAACLLLIDRFRLTSVTPLELSIAALEDRARTFEASVGMGEQAIDRTTGVAQSADAIAWLRTRQAPAAGRSQYAVVRPPPIYFWYRSSPRPLVPRDPSDRRPGPQDPPLTASGMTIVALDMKGRLVEFGAVPPQVESLATPASAPIDWKVFFDAAGLDLASFEPAVPDWTPRLFADARKAWVGIAPDLPGVPLRIEAASHLGRPVNFQIIGPWARPTRMRAPPADRGTEIISLVASSIVVPLCLTGGILLARRNLRRGRGDRRGAVRLAIVIFGLSLAEWVFGAAHFTTLAAEQARFGTALSNALFAAALWGLIYLAIEPQVRRLRPAMLVTWSRIGRGRFRDPFFGRDLAIGALAGLSCTLLTYTVYLLPSVFAWPDMTPPGGVEGLRGTSVPIAMAFAILAGAIQNSFLGGVGIVMVRLLVPSFRIAFAIAVVPFSFLAAQGQISTGSLWLDLLFGLALVVIMAGVIVRFGLVAGAASFFVHFATIGFPLTLDRSRFFFGLSTAVVVTVCLIGLAGVVLARGREPLFGRVIADDGA